MTAEELNHIANIFPSAKFEAIDGIWIYDKANNFIGAYLNRGFSLNMDYKHVEKIQERIAEFGYSQWDHEIYQETENAKIIESIT